MENYPGNSRKAREEPKEPKKIEKVVTGRAVKRKKPLGKRLAETFVGGSDASSVWKYVFYDVLVPAAKDMVSDAFSQGIERMLFGDVRRPGGPRSRASSSYSAYNRYSAPGPMMGRREEPRREVSRHARATHNFDEIIVPTMVEANAIIDQMFAVLSQYDIVTLAELYEMADVESEFTDQNWGWDNLSGAGVTRVRNGYLLDLPEPKEIH